jgi:hypothetical protein
MRLAPFTVGEESTRILRRRNVRVRATARLAGSPSAPADVGYLSTSSRNKSRIGRAARLAGLFAPAIVTCPPGNVLWSSVELVRCERDNATRDANSGHKRIAGVSRSFEKAEASSRVGWSTIAGAGSRWIARPSALTISSVPPIWLLFISTTVSTSGRVQQAMTSRR